MKTIKSRQSNKLPISLASIDCPLAVSASVVAAKLERIRIIVTARRNQRSEVCNETRVVMNMDIPLSHTTLFMDYLLCFNDEVDSFRYQHDANVRNWYPPAGFQTLYNLLPPYKRDDSHLYRFH